VPQKSPSQKQSVTVKSLLTKNTPGSRIILEVKMTKADLMKQLESMPDNALIVLSKDAEGNDFRKLDEIVLGFYDADEKEFFEEQEESDSETVAICF
jgi:hypothetical protein